MVTRSNFHNPGFLPGFFFSIISCSRFPVRSWINTSLSMSSACLHICLHVLALLGVVFNFCFWLIVDPETVLTSADLYSKHHGSSWECCHVLYSFWISENCKPGAYCFWMVCLSSTSVPVPEQSRRCTTWYQKQPRHLALRSGIPVGRRRAQHGVWMATLKVDTLHSSTSCFQVFSSSQKWGRVVVHVNTGVSVSVLCPRI